MAKKYFIPNDLIYNHPRTAFRHRKMVYWSDDKDVLCLYIKNSFSWQCFYNVTSPKTKDGYIGEADSVDRYFKNVIKEYKKQL